MAHIQFLIDMSISKAREGVFRLKKLLKELEAISFEQKRLVELEDLLLRMRLIAYEAITSDEKRRGHLQKQFENLQAQVTFLESEKRQSID